MIVNEDLSRIAVEILALLDNVSDEIYDKIPTEFINYLVEIQAYDYYFEYDMNKSLKEQNFSDGALKMIGLIYKDYLSDENEKKEYIDLINDYNIKQEEEKQEKYNPDNIFKQDEERLTNEENLPVKIEEGFFSKVLRAIKRFFKW